LSNDIVKQLQDEIGSTTVLVFAGGMYKRMGIDHPKALATLGNEKLIDRCIKFYKDCGFENFVFLLGEGNEEIINHINKMRYGINIKISLDPIMSSEISKESLGNAKAILNALNQGNIIDETRRSIVAYPDDVFTDNKLLVRMMRAHLDAVIRFRVAATLAYVDGAKWPYGVIDVNSSGLITRFEEKPLIIKPTYAGIAVLEPSAYKLIKEVVDFNESKTQELDLVFNVLVSQQNVFGFRIQPDCWISINTLKDLENAEHILQRI
jgi:NDP-sugar pyrophosphorylase family protein